MCPRLRGYNVKLLTKEIERKLLANADLPEEERKPWLKLFGGGACTWLISEIVEVVPESGGDMTLFGLCDLGMGFPELGYVSFNELRELKFPPFGLPIERDLHWSPSLSIGAYAEAARERGRIVDPMRETSDLISRRVLEGR